MIKIRIQNAAYNTDIRFPISEAALSEKLDEIYVLKNRESSQSVFVAEVCWPEEFSMLKNNFANLDELNYLGKRMESFDALEYDQFIIGVSKLEKPDVKALINLTFNLSHFTLCKNVSSYAKLGRAYILNTEGMVSAGDEEEPKYAVIGKKLIDRGITQVTARGLLIYDPLDKPEEVYDGKTFPEYYYKNSLLNICAEYKGRKELLQLPDEELAIKKAIARLGKPYMEECSFKIASHNIESAEWVKRIEDIIKKEGIYEANAMVKSLDREEMDWDKLSAMVELAGVHKAANIAFLAENYDEFYFIQNVDTEEDVGRYLVDNESEYNLALEMEDFFDFAGFGEHFAEEHDGRFINGGFVNFDGDNTLDKFLEDIETESDDITMGGL